MAEAVAWDWLVHRVDRVSPCPTSNDPTPDFECSHAGRTFFVEVTNIDRASMTKETVMRDRGAFSGNARPPWNRFHREICGKAKKGALLSAPYVVFVTTLHRNSHRFLASRFFLAGILHSPTSICGYIDAEGDAVGEPFIGVDLRRAAFSKSESLDSARPFVSAVLIGSLGNYPQDVTVHGLIHPEASHPFDPATFPDAPFCRFHVWPPPLQGSRDLVEWSDQPLPKPSRPEIVTSITFENSYDAVMKGLALEKRMNFDAPLRRRR